MPIMETYAIAVKRNSREEITIADALNLIRDIQGVRILDEAARGIARITVSEAALGEVRTRLSPLCHIESCVMHFPQAVA